jgi:hypothetical protein
MSLTSLGSAVRSPLSYTQLPQDIHSLIYRYLVPSDLCTLLDVDQASRNAVTTWIFYPQNIRELFHRYIGALKPDETLPLSQRVINGVFESVQHIRLLPLWIEAKLQKKDKILQIQGSTYARPTFALKGAIMLMRWYTAHDTFCIWMKCAEIIGQTRPYPKLKSLKDGLQKASGFSKWTQDNANKLIRLELLYLDNRRIIDLTALNHLTQLQGLNLDSNWIIDLTPLSRLNQLQWLFVSNNRILDLTPLSSLTQLKQLDLGNNQIVDLTPLSPLTQLQELVLSNNPIADLSLVKQLRDKDIKVTL